MTLSLALEEKGADGSQTLREEMIARALDEGRSVADIAEALAITPQAVYKVRARRREEPLGAQGAPSDLRAVVVALDTMTDHVAFEQLVAALMGDIDPTAIPIGGPGDRGRDAASPDSTTIFTVSLDRQWKRKVERDLEKIEKHGYEPERIFSVTNRRTSRKTVEALIAKVAKKGIALNVLDQKWLVGKLSEAPHLHLRGEILGIAAPRSRSFHRAEAYRALLDGRPHLSGLGVRFSGRQVELRRAGEILEGEGVVLLSGPGGYGKTRLAIELAGEDDGPWSFIDAGMPFTPESVKELPISDRLVVVVDNAHRRTDLGALLSALEDLPRGAPRLVLLARPGFEDRLNGAIAASRWGAIDATRTVAIGPLGWRTMAEILKASPLEIESGPQRGAIIQLAEGNPQIAVIAARVATERRSVIGLSGDELLQRYIAYLIPAAITEGSDVRRQQQLLALLAALDGIDSDETDLIAVIGEMLRLRPEQVVEGLEQLAESGLVIADTVRRPELQRYRIKPDLLAEHILFALTLTERWQLALDFAQIYRRFAPGHLQRMVRAIGALPSGLFDSDAAERLRGLERDVAAVAKEGEAAYAAELIRELSHARPEFAQTQANALLDRIAAEGGRPEDTLINRLREGAMRMTDFPRSWRLLLRLGAESSGSPLALKTIRESMSSTYERVPEDDANSGAVLAAVQDSLAVETRRFWEKRGPGAASAVALAVKPMLMVSFETSRASADDPMTIELGGRILPVSKYTKAVLDEGGTLAAEVITELPPSEQLRLLKDLARAAHTAAGFSFFPGPAPLPGRILIDLALEEVDEALAEQLEDFLMPVRRAAYDYLLKRARYRRKLAAELEEHDDPPEGTVERRGSVKVPTPSEAFEEYLVMVNNRPVGLPEGERGSFEEEFERERARARQRAELLRADPDWRAVVDRWSAWWQLRLDLEREGPALGQAPAMVFEAVALTDPELGAEIIDHLVETESGLRGAAAAAMSAVVDALAPGRWEGWLDADAITRGTLARALANFDEQTAAEGMRKLAFDKEESVRSAATSALAFSMSPSGWRLDLGLEAATRHPDIEAVGQFLHLADMEADKGNGEQADFSEEQVRMISAAILATAASEKIDSYRLADSLQRAERQSPGLVMDWIWARLEALEQITDGQSALHLWDLDFLDEQLQPLVSEVAGEDELQHALELFKAARDRSPALGDIAKVISWIDPGASAVTELMLRELADPERAWRVRTNLMDLPLPPEQLEDRAERFAVELEEPLVALLDLIDGTVPNTWSGSRVPHLENGLVIAKEWAGSEQRRLREAGLEAVAIYERRIKREADDEAREDLEFEYR